MQNSQEMREHLKKIADNDAYKKGAEIFFKSPEAKGIFTAHWKRHPVYQEEEVERAEKLRHTPGAVHSHDPAYADPHKNK